MSEEIYFANEAATKLDMKCSDVCVLARLMGMPKVGGSYRFTEWHLKKLRAVIGIINVIMQGNYKEAL